MPTRLVRLTLIVLVILGVVASLGRVLAITHVAAPVTEARLHAARAFTPGDPSEIDRLERHFAEGASLAFLHVTVGAVFFTLGLLQFSRTIRSRHPRYHRRSGYLLVGLAVIAGVSGLWMGIVDPYSATERLPTAVIGFLFLIAPGMAVRAIRRGDRVRHREWMIRFFALGLGVVVIRLVAVPILWIVRPVPFHDVVGLTFWAGWIVTSASGEWWIRTTRARPSLAPVDARPSFAQGRPS